MRALYQEIRYFYQRIQLIAVYYIITQLLMRAYILRDILGNGNIDVDIYYHLALLGIGILNDICFFTVLIIPYAVYLIYTSRYYQGSTTDKCITCLLFYGYIFSFITILLLQLFFWSRSGRQFSDLLLHNLHYITDAIDDAILRFPLILLCFTIATTCAMLLWLHCNNLCHDNRQKRNITITSRLFLSFMSVLLIVGGYVLTKENQVYCSFCVQNITNNTWYQTLIRYRPQKTLDYEQIFPSAVKQKSHSAAKKIEYIASTIPMPEYIATKMNMLSISNGQQRQTQRLNVVMLIMDGLPASALWGTKSKKPLAPALSKLSTQSVAFQSAYATHTNYIGGLISTLLSKIAAPNNMLDRGLWRLDNHGHELASLSSTLYKHHYDTKLFTTSDQQWSKIIAMLHGSQLKVVSSTSPKEQKDAESTRHILRKQIDYANQNHRNEQNFFHIITTPLNKHIATKNQYIKNTDDLIAEYMETIHSKAWFRHTIFVIVSARSSVNFTFKAIEPSNYHIPWLIYAPSVLQPMKISYQVSQIDIAPTILGLLRLPSSSAFDGKNAMLHHVGRSVMQDDVTLSYLEDNNMILLLPGQRFCYYNEPNNHSYKLQISNLRKVCRKQTISNNLSETHRDKAFFDNKDVSSFLIKAIALYDNAIRKKAV